MKAMLICLAALVAVAISAVVQHPMHKSSFPRRTPNRRLLGYKTGRGPQRELAASTGSGSQPINDYYDEVYVANITIGTPGQTLSFAVDTGVSNLFVVGDICPSQACTGSPGGYTRHRFNTTTSSTLKWVGDKFVEVNDDYYVEGNVAVDTITLGGLTYDSQPIGVIWGLSGNFMDYPSDGVLGLGWPNDFPADCVPVMTNLLPQLDLPIFTIWLDRHSLPLENKLGGLITYGALDAVNCDAQVNYVTLSTKSYWQFALNNFQVSGFSTAGSQQALSISSYAFIGAPPAAFDAIISATGAAYDSDSLYYVLPCKGDYPDLVFTIGGNTFSMPASEYILNLGIGGGRCALMVAQAPANIGVSASWILGEPFIRTFCHVHDYGNARIGFARAHHKER